VQIQGLSDKEVGTMEEMLQVISYGNSVRTTHQTVANDTSSRSHAICQVRYFFNIQLKNISDHSS
jgi:kinesin family protein 2/24